MSYPSTAPRSYQIDVIDQVSRAYRVVFDNLQLVAEIALLPFLIVFGIELVALLIPVEVAVDIHHNEADVPAGFYAFITDISERKRAADALRESEERYRQLYDEAPVGYHEIDSEGRIVNINRTECEMLGYSREEMIGRPIFDFVAPENREQAREAVREKVAGTRPLAPITAEYSKTLQRTAG